MSAYLKSDWSSHLGAESLSHLHGKHTLGWWQPSLPYLKSALYACTWVLRHLKSAPGCTWMSYAQTCPSVMSERYLKSVLASWSTRVQENNTNTHTSHHCIQC